MSIDLNQLSVWAALITAATAVVALILENRRTRFSVGVDLLFRLDEQFHSERIVATRAKAAQSLLANENSEEVSDLLDWFDGIGFLLKKGALDKDMVYSYWSFWVVPFWFASKAVIDTAYYDEFWVNYAYLVESVKKIDNSRGKNGELYPPSNEYIASFLTDESKT